MQQDKLPAEVLGWWLVPSDFKLANGDGRVAKLGDTQEVKGHIRACGNGLHASTRLVDALGLCPSNCTQLFLVKLHGDMDGHDWQEDRYHKIAAQYRTYLAHITIDDAIRDICLNVIKQGIRERKRRIARYGKDAGYKDVPQSIVDFAHTGVLSQTFWETIKGVFNADPWRRLRDGIKVLLEREVTHEKLKSTVKLVADQFGLTESDVWKDTEQLVLRMMTDRVTDKNLLPKEVKALPPPIPVEQLAEEAAEIDAAIRAIGSGQKLLPAPTPDTPPEVKAAVAKVKRTKKVSRAKRLIKAAKQARAIAQEKGKARVARKAKKAKRKKHA